MTIKTTLLAAAALAALGSTTLLAAGPAQAAAPTASSGPDYELPFACGETWVGSSRASHSPSPRAIDFNRTNDLNMPVLASAPGTVVKVADLGNRSYGRYVFIDHGSDRYSVYAHLNAYVVTPGQHVDQGQMIGLLGSTGGSTGPHLHFEERYGGSVLTSYFHRASYTMGRAITSASCNDTPVAGDWNGDGTDSVGVYRDAPGGGSYLRSGASTIPFGTGRDAVFTGDWDGNGTSNVGVRPGASTVSVRRSPGTGLVRTTIGDVYSLPVAGDWNGDRKDDLGTFRPDTGMWTLRSASGALTRVQYGQRGDLPLPGDWNGDGKDELGVYRPSTRTFYMRVVVAGRQQPSRTATFGSSDQLPVAGDWNGDHYDDLGAWSRSTATFTLRTAKPNGTLPTFRTQRYGNPRG